NSFNQSGVYGTQGTAAATNLPGGRWAAANFVDNAGNVWLFGGQGVDSGGTIGLLNDLWEYNSASGQWTWVSGANTANQNGVYGTQTAAAAGNVPGSRWGPVGWTDASNNLWFFGGWGYGSKITQPTGFLNDIWEYQQSSGQWIWWKGTSNVNENGESLTTRIPVV